MQWETKPCLLWDYSQDKALSGCADIVRPERKIITSKRGGGGEPPMKTRDGIKKKGRDREEQDNFLFNGREHLH